MNDPAAAPGPFERRMTELGLRMEDIEETFVRSGGHGGQNVNKVATCVVLRHRPSGTLVKCQVSRHQGRNRELARAMLLEKLETARRQAALQATAQREKERRKNRPRSRAAKQRILADKSRNAARKASRRIRSED